MRRYAFLLSLALLAACAPDRVPPAAPDAVAFAGPVANVGDPNDDFHPFTDADEFSHFRLGHLSWRKTGPTTAEFTYVVAFRRSAFSPLATVGSTRTLVTLNFSGGQGGVNPLFTITFVDAAGDWFEARATFSKTFTGTGPYDAVSTGCCRIGTSSTPGWAHINNPDQSIRYWGKVDLNYAGSPASSLPPMVTCPIGGTCTFFVGATAPSGLSVRWRLATPAEMGQTGSTHPGPPDAPNPASVNGATGLYSWNAAGAILGAAPRKTAYSTQVVMEGVDANNIVRTASMMDFLIHLADIQINAPPAFQAPTPADGSNYTVDPGVPLNLALVANDPDGADVVSISGLGMPAGATLSGAPGNPANSTFSFTATAGQAGQSFVIAFVPTDNRGLSGSQRSVRIDVRSNRPPTASITGATSVPEGSQIDLDGSGSSDPDGDQLHYAWTVNGSPAGGDSQNLGIQVGDGPATLNVELIVTDGNGGSATTTHVVTVNNVAPHGTLGAQSPVDEGQGFAVNFTDVDDPSPADISAIVNAAFDCGGGAGYGAFSTALNAVCPTVDNGTRTVRGKLRDKDGGETEYVTTVIVNNVSPVVSVAPAGSILSGGTYNLSGTFSDVGVADSPWSYLIDWGNGTTGGSTGTQGAIAAAHGYLVPGTYPISLTVTDKDGGSGVATTSLTVERLPISCDVKPETINLRGDASNAGNGKGGGAPAGMVIVHCFSTATVDVTTLVAPTGSLGDNVGNDTPVARRNNGSYYVSIDDLNDDGRPDIVVHFNRSDMIANGDLVGGIPRLYFRGVLADGRYVIGSDAVRVIP